MSELAVLHVERMVWAAWKPTEYANLCFVMRDGQILLIRKKRGLGAGEDQWAWWAVGKGGDGAGVGNPRDAGVRSG